MSDKNQQENSTEVFYSRRVPHVGVLTFEYSVEDGHDVAWAVMTKRRKRYPMAKIEFLDEEHVLISAWDGVSDEPAFTLMRGLRAEGLMDHLFVDPEKDLVDSWDVFVRDTVSGSLLYFTVGIGAPPEDSREWHLILGNKSLIGIIRWDREADRKQEERNSLTLKVYRIGEEAFSVDWPV